MRQHPPLSENCPAPPNKQAHCWSFLHLAMATGLLFLLASPRVLWGQSTIYVDLTALGGNSGASWDDAFVFLQDALAAAGPGDQVWVAQGLHRPDRGTGRLSMDVHAAFRVPWRVTLVGGFLGGETSASDRLEGGRSVLTGDLAKDDPAGVAPVPGAANMEDNSINLVLFDGQEVVIDGFSVQGATGLAIGGSHNCIVRNTDIIENLGEVDLRNCTLEGLYVARNSTFESAVMLGGRSVIRGSWFEDNETQSWWPGGAVLLEPGRGDTLIVETSTFYRNRGIFGGGLASVGLGAAILVSVRFIANHARCGGGALSAHNGTEVTVVNGLFVSNWTDEDCYPAGGFKYRGGGAIVMNQSELDLHFSTFADNHTPTRGDAINLFLSNRSVIQSSIFYRNGAEETPDLFAEGRLRLRCSLIDQDLAPGPSDSITSTRVGSASFVDLDGADDVLGTSDDNGAISTESLGVDGAISNECELLEDYSDLDRDGRLQEPTPLDLAGNSRLRGAAADLGAYEAGWVQRILYVDDDGPQNGDGTSWSNALQSLQVALSMAAGDNEIWVAEGVYRPDVGPSVALGDRDAAFVIPPGVALFGGFRGTESTLIQRPASLPPTVLSGDLDGNDPGHRPRIDQLPLFDDNSTEVVSGHRGLSMDGFIVRGGREVALSVSGDQSPCSLTSMVIEMNVGRAAASVSACDLESVEIQYNNTPDGAALSISGGSLRQSKIGENFGGSNGGGISVHGPDTTLISESIIWENSSDYGGGLISGGGTTIILVSTRVFSNIARCGGGGLYVAGSMVILVNSLFASNRVEGPCQSPGRGGAAFVSGGRLEAYNSTFVNNVAFAGEAFWYQSSTGRLFNSIVATSGSDTPDFVLWNSSVSVLGLLHDEPLPSAMSEAEGAVWGAPLFVEPSRTDPRFGGYRLNGFSPGIDAGFEEVLPPDWADLDRDGDRREPLSVDISGEIRIRGLRIDLGAFEGFTATGIDELETLEESPQLFPNPTSGRFTLKMASVKCGRTAEVFDMIGRRVHRLNLPCDAAANEFNLNGEAAGAYFVVVHDGLSVDVIPFTLTR